MRPLRRFVKRLGAWASGRRKAEERLRAEVEDHIARQTARKSYDPLVTSIAVLALGLSALAASLIPALRASSISPLEALQIEAL